LILDLSIAMLEKDLRPTRYLLTIRYASDFVSEFFEQNPISQLGIIGMRDGLAVRISNMSGNPNDHISSLHDLRKQEARGQPSLENGLEMARASLFHAPTHGTREVLLVFGALHTADPGDIHLTIANLVKDKIRARVIGLAAQVAICAELVSKTNNGDRSNYSIVLNEQHFRELMMELTTPPVTSAQTKSASSLLMMGFPSRTVETHPSLCACHSRPSREGYLCSRCGSKVCSLPSECPTCGLTLILSTHLARSYHHLFPLVNWEEVHWPDAWRSSHCFACGKSFPEVPPKERWANKGEGSSGRYECTACRRHFCIDCDLFAHEVVHNCPGCQSGMGFGNDAAGHMDKTVDVIVEGDAPRSVDANGNAEAEKMDSG
jgi:transcription initiation factor TFIIH subunit 2